MKRVFTLFFTLIICINLYAQTNKVELKIISSETGYSLTPEHITISNTNEKTPAGLKKVGNYHNANLPAGLYMISVSKEGYSACESYFEIKDKDVKYDIFLDPLSKNPLLKTERIKSLLKDNFTLLLGYVVDDETGEPLNSVLVKDESTAGAVTNSGGYFEFYLPGVCEKRSFVNLTFSKPGYIIEEYKDFELFSNIDFEFTVRLKKEKSQVFIQNHKLTEPVCDECNNKGPMLNPPVSGFVLPVNIRVGRNCTGINCTYAQIYSVETYCKYVLPAEIYACWGNINGGMNSLQACAVAVRTYGVYHVYNPINPSLYDICDNTYCQYMGNVTSSNTNNAVDNTFRYILVNSGGVVRSEYSAENNNKGCGNGYSGTGSSWPCIYDPVCTNGTPNGHGRGLCQWGTVRWATGTLVTTSSPCSAGIPHAYGTMTWQQILNHYYNVSPQNWTVYFGITATMITSSCLPQAANACSTITITNSVNATSQVSLMLGASIAPTGTTNWISDPVHDVKLTFNQGTGTYNRLFTVPCSAQPGTYDLLTAVWYDKDNNNQINTGDFVVNSRLTPAALTISPVGIKIISSDIPKSYRLYQNFPNPFNPVTKIKFDIPSSKTHVNASLQIFDILGREVTTLVDQQLKPGTYEVDWPACRSCGAGMDASDYPSGVYFYKLISKDYIQTRKMILLK